MLTYYVALKYLGHPSRKQKQRETLPHTQVEHLHQQMLLGEVKRGSFQWCVQGVQLLLALCVSLAQTYAFSCMSSVKGTWLQMSQYLHAYGWMKIAFSVTTSVSGLKCLQRIQFLHEHLVNCGLVALLGR